MYRFARWLALVMAWMWLVGCAHAVPSPVPAPLSLRLTVGPRTGLAPLMVSARIRVTDPQAQLACPQFGLTWGIRDEPAESSGFQGDYCGTEGGPRIHSPLPRRLALRAPGTYEIHATMADHGIALHDSATVEVLGAPE